eukprot:TRINITY_DN12595_c0_g1_i1.p1 TRINITY_DN12595_c0_g1~~TRINITY_DN12595_c0_g1_i1.p1  ORF type:complete len:309 (-),score=44.02 TRINITY_DN12595_c0_g1_i1:10-936(-)
MGYSLDAKTSVQITPNRNSIKEVKFQNAIPRLSIPPPEPRRVSFSEYSTEKSENEKNRASRTLMRNQSIEKKRPSMLENQHPQQQQQMKTIETKPEQGITSVSQVEIDMPSPKNLKDTKSYLIFNARNILDQGLRPQNLQDYIKSKDQKEPAQKDLTSAVEKSIEHRRKYIPDEIQMLLMNQQLAVKPSPNSTIPYSEIAKQMQTRATIFNQPLRQLNPPLEPRPLENLSTSSKKLNTTQRKQTFTNSIHTTEKELLDVLTRNARNQREKEARTEIITRLLGLSEPVSYTHLSCRRSTLCRSRWSPYH